MGTFKPIACLCFFAYILFDVSVSRTVTTNEYCTSKECIVAAGNILSIANLSADPCDDFYAFACGNWKKEHPLTFENIESSYFIEAQEKVYVVLRDKLSEDSKPTSKSIEDVKVFFNTCMSSGSELEGLMEDLLILNKWPIVAGNSWDSETFDFNDMFTTVKYLSLGDILLSIGVYNDYKNTSIYALHINQVTSLGVKPVHLLYPENYTDVIAAYKAFISGAAYVLGADATDSLTVEKDVEDLVTFETEIAKIIEPGEDKLNYTLLNNKMSVKSLQRNAGTFFQWNELLVYLLNNTNISDNDEVIVESVNFIINLDALLKKTENRTIANYMLWRYVQYHSSNVGDDELEKLKFNFGSAMFGIRDEQQKWRSCVYLVDSLFGFATARLYVEKNFAQDTKDQAAEMVSFIRKVFSDQISTEKWMTNNETRSKAIEKAEYISQYIGYPDWIFNDTALDDIYEIFYIGNVSHFENVKQSIYTINEEMFALMYTKATKLEWIMTPTAVNAMYSPIENTITFPAAILQAPFFETGRTKSLNFGAIGMIIGHEITHGFDNIGRQFDKNGNLNNWWDYSTEKKYQELTKCFVDEYNQFCPEELKSSQTCLNGEYTLSENIADSVGLKTAFSAYSLWEAHHNTDGQLPGLESFSNDQLFFLSMAQLWCVHETKQIYEMLAIYNVHSLNKYRVNGALSNSFEFVNAYQCIGKPMDRPRKCVLW